MKKRVSSALAKSSCLTLLLVAVIFAASTAFAEKQLATVNIPVQPELYATTPAPLTPTQCAQCHTYQFGALKENGGRHRFGCQQCHKVIHAYNPKKQNYDEIMPKCSNCHTDIHGPANKDCSSCHANPHTPRKVAMTPRLTSSCAVCHPGPKADMVKFPSKHALLGCERCHTSHGFIPSCAKCHQPHYKGQEFSSCTRCHSVHKPKQVTYGAKEPAATCGSCHKEIYNKWSKTPSRHRNVNCAQCHHDRHGYIPQCTECHKAPHPAGILQKFPKCLSCHLDVHDLPKMK